MLVREGELEEDRRATVAARLHIGPGLEVTVTHLIDWIVVQGMSKLRRVVDIWRQRATAGDGGSLCRGVCSERLHTSRRH